MSTFAVVPALLVALPLVCVGLVGAAAASAVASTARPLSCAVPSAPTSQQAVAGTNQATITWTAADGNGSTLTGNVVRALSGPNAGESIATEGSAAQLTMGGLAGGSPVTFSVVAESACGTGPTATTTAVTPTGTATTYVTTVLAKHPSAYYRLSDPSGTIMADSSGNAADGQYTTSNSNAITLGQPGAIPDDPDTSVNDNGDSEIASANPALPEGNTSRTIEAWVKTPGPTLGCSTCAFLPVASYGTNSASEMFSLSLVGNGGGEPWTGTGGADSIDINDGDNGFQAINTSRPIDDDNWHLVTVTYDQATDVATAYLDGQAVGTTAFTGGLDTTADAGGLSVGTSAEYYSEPFPGNLQELAIFPSALTAKQVAAQFAASGYGRPSAPVDVHASYGGKNAAQISWGYSTATNTNVEGYLVSVVGGPNTGQSESVSGDSTAAQMSGLASGPQTFSVQAFDSFGPGPPDDSTAFSIAGSKSTYASTVLAAKPSFFYRLNDTGTQTMVDSSGHGLNGTYGSASFASLGEPGPLGNDDATSTFDPWFGQSPSMMGIGPSTAQSAVPLGNHSFSVELWFEQTPLDFNNYGNPLVFWGQRGNGLEVSQPAADQINVTDFETSQSLTFLTPYQIDDGVWHQITVTYHGKDQQVVVYLDGVAIGSQKFADPLDTLPALFALGAAASGWALEGTGLADVALYPDLLSAAQVSAHFAAAGYAPPTAPSGVGATAGTNQATVTWTASAPSDPPVEGYLVTALKGTKAKAANAVAVAASASTAAITGLAGGTTYGFEVQAVNTYGLSPPALTTSDITTTGSASTYASTVLADGPSVFYRLDDSTAGILADSSGNGQNGRYVASVADLGVTPGPISSDPAAGVGATLVGGNFNQGASAYGTGSTADFTGACGATALPLGNCARTVEVWLQTGTENTHVPLLGWGASGTDEAFSVFLAPSQSEIEVSGSNDDLGFTTSAAFDDNAWHLLTVTYDGTNVVVYFDGVQLGSSQQFQNPLDTQPQVLGLLTTPNYEGSGSDAGPQSINLGDVAIFPTALTAAQVAAQYAASGDSP